MMMRYLSTVATVGAVLMAGPASATSFPRTPIVCIAVDAPDSADPGFLYDDGDGSQCSAVGEGILCRAESGPNGLYGISALPPTDGDAYSVDYMPAPRADHSILQQACDPIPGYRACCRLQTVFMSSPENFFRPAVTSATKCKYRAATVRVLGAARLRR